MNNKKKALTICLVLLVLAQFISLIVFYAELLPISAFTQLGHVTSTSGAILLYTALNALVDTVLALSVAVLLYRRRTATPFRRTSSIIDRIMMYTVGSGLLTAAVAFAAFVAFLTMPNNLIFIMLQEISPKCELHYCGMLVY